MQQAITQYLNEVTEQFNSGHAIEHAYRPALKHLMDVFEDTTAVNNPKHSEHDAPDFVFLKKSNTKIIKGYSESKDITVSLDETEKTNQTERQWRDDVIVGEPQGRGCMRRPEKGLAAFVDD